MHAAEYYLERKAYVASIKRASYVLENIPNSDQNHRALQVLSVAYENLGYDDLLEDTKKLIALNPPLPQKDINRGSLSDINVGSIILPALALISFSSNWNLY